MKFLLTPSEVKAVDTGATEHFGIPSIVLMENAANNASRTIIKLVKKKKIKKDSKILILCGSGNNGGDGFAIARHLNETYSTSVYWIGNTDKMSEETFINYTSATKLIKDIHHIKDKSELNCLTFNFDIIIDAFIGVGGSENIKGIALDILVKIKELNSIKIAIDSPTGLNTLTGAANIHCFKADYTITMFAPKLGMFLKDGNEYCGKIITVKLGSPNSTLKDVSNNYIMNNKDIKILIPKRVKKTTKFDFGKLLIIAGSDKYSGAAALAANSAMKSGAGLVYLFSTTFHSSLYPEVIKIQAENSNGSISLDNLNWLKTNINNYTASVIGPGITKEEGTINLIKSLIYSSDIDIPMIIDADAISAIDLNKKLRKNIILTPHIGEFANLTGLTIQEIIIDEYSIVKQVSKSLNCIIHLKSMPSITTDGIKTYLSIYGNPGMATAGSGDVLSGIIGSFLAQGLDPLIATSLASLVHAKSGDNYLKYGSESTLIATDLINNLQYVL